jgi:hypothetical protein
MIANGGSRERERRRTEDERGDDCFDVHGDSALVQLEGQR